MALKFIFIVGFVSLVAAASQAQDWKLERSLDRTVCDQVLISECDSDDEVVVSISAEGKGQVKSVAASPKSIALQKQLQKYAKEDGLKAEDYDCLVRTVQATRSELVVAVTVKRNAYCDSAMMQSLLYHSQELLDKSPYTYQMAQLNSGQQMNLVRATDAGQITHIFKAKDNK